jgi:hypothetical protein
MDGPDHLTLSRCLSPRFDLSAEVDLPPLRRHALAHEIRKDVWRVLRRLRGFAPVVQVTPDGHGLRVRAGGAVAGAVPASAHVALCDVLNDPDCRARWIRHARLRP